jgi:hypothetical protein
MASQEEVNIDYGESPVETKIVSENQATLDELVDISKCIYKDIVQYCKDKRGIKEIIRTPRSYEDCRNRFERLGLISRDKLERPKPKKVEYNDDPLDQNLESDEYTKVVKHLQEKYRSFHSSFPIFIRYTVQTLDYSPVAFRKFIDDYRKAVLKTELQFFELQRNYIVYLYRELNGHWSPEDVRRLSSNIMDALIKEKKDLKKITDEVDEEMKERGVKIRAAKRAELLKFMATHKIGAFAATAQPPQTTTQTDAQPSTTQNVD